jgi:thiamine-phosphate pyrophosphorylase
VAIGGITAQNAGRVIEAGADAVAVVNGLFGAPDIESEGRRLLDVVAAALARQVAEQAAS